MLDLLAPSELLRWELTQRRESGYDLAGVEADVRAALGENVLRVLRDVPARPRATS